MVEAYRNLDQGEENPYRFLDKSDHFSLIHDATTYFVKQMNTSIIRIVKGDGTIVKVPFDMKKVNGSLTGEVLCEELMGEISTVKKVKNNANETIGSWLSGAHTAGNVIADIQEKLKQATGNLDLPLIESLTKELQTTLRQQADSSIEDIMPVTPLYFKIATVKGLKTETYTLHLEIQASVYPASVCGDSCSVNLKAQRLLEEIYGIISPFSNCTSHIASGTIRRLATSETMCDENVKSLYNLIKILRHFSQSPKSTEMLNRTLTALEMNNVHMLVWCGTRMAGFLDGCLQCSDILISLMDTLVTGSIRDEETSFLMSPKGIFLLQLMADIHPVFANKYLHKTDSDTVISCETKGIATKTVERLRNLEAPRCMEVYESLYQDRYQNICVKLKDPKNPDATHDLTLNTKVTRHKTLESHKNNLLQIKDNVIECMIDNINDQVDNANLMSKLSCLDESSFSNIWNRC